MTKIDDTALRQLFLDARTQNKWLPKDVTDAQLHEIVDIMKMGPTSMNTQPMRILFVRSKEAKERLKPFLTPGNVDKTMAAPVCAILGNDMAFYEHLPRTFPHKADAKDMYIGKDAMISGTAFRNGTLQGAYLMIAARAVGLDVGAMSGFDKGKVDEAFFAGTTIKSNFLCNIGHGDPAGVFGKLPRLPFEEACSIA